MRSSPLLLLLAACVACAGRAHASATTNLDFAASAMPASRCSSATQSFKAILGRPSGPCSAAASKLGLPNHLFLSLGRVALPPHGSSRLRVRGPGVQLNVADTITITPLELTRQATASARCGRTSSPTSVAASGGTSTRRRRRTRPRPTTCTTTHTGYHVLGGAEIPLQKWLAARGRCAVVVGPQRASATSRRRRRASTTNTISAGFTLRVKIVVGR